jgi:hypothetical protein
MARYDRWMGGGYGRPNYGRYDADRGYGGHRGGRGYDGRDFGGGFGGNDRGGYDRTFREPRDRDDEAWGETAGGIYGPARYGLGPYYRRLLERKRPDDELREEVEEALFYDSWVDAEAITVDVDGGVVTLRGQLPDYEEIRYAIDDAWDVDGVRGVRSELEIREEE